jgi:hypothetical protein
MMPKENGLKILEGFTTLSEKQTAKPIIVTPPKAHSKKQQFIYSAFGYPSIREVWVCAGTKFGKTLAASACQINYALPRPNTKHRWVAPIYAQTRQPMEYFERILPSGDHRKINKGENVIYLPHTNSRIEFWHSQSPSSLEGDGIHSYVFDEAARQPPDIKSSARTTTTKTKGPMIFISYPYGKNWFYDGCMEAQDHMLWAFKNNKPYEKIFLHARTADNPTIDPQVIENAKKELPWRLFRQFYLAEFVDDGAVFTNIDGCTFGEKFILTGEIHQWFDPSFKEYSVVIGADWAKKQDFTVFIAIDMASGRVVGIMRFHRKPYTEQVRILAFFARKFKYVEMILHDKTGVGEAIDDNLAYINQPYRGIIQTNSLKAELIMKLITGFEQGQIKIPFWSEMIGELRAYEVKVNALGTTQYGAPSGKHDDIVSSLAFAWYAYETYSEHDMQVKFLDDLQSESQNDKTELEHYYNDMMEDDF